MSLRVGYLCAALVWCGHAAQAASLQVSPTFVEVPALSTTTMLTVRNDGALPVNAQVRVYRWTQVNGEDVLEPTNAVAASPPMVALRPKANYSVRLVRTDRRPVETEEAYRLVVDELPDAKGPQRSGVSMLLRYSVPVFFLPSRTAEPKLSWSARLQNGELHLQLSNSGGRRIRLSDVKVSDGRTSTKFGKGLMGYSLANSSVSWTESARGLSRSNLVIEAQSDRGPVRATVSPN